MEMSIWLSIELRFVIVGAQPEEEKTKKPLRLSGILSWVGYFHYL